MSYLTEKKASELCHLENLSLCRLQTNAKICSEKRTKDVLEKYFAAKISYMIKNLSQLNSGIDMEFSMNNLLRTFMPNSIKPLTYIWYHKIFKKIIPAEALLALAERHNEYTK